MSDQSWWDRKLGRTGTPQRQPGTPQHHRTRDPQPQYPARPQAPQQPSQQRPASVPSDNVNREYENYTEGLTDPDSAQHWRNASKAEKFENESCPNCFSDNFFSRGFTESGAPRRGPNPAPECFDCGYPNIQSGSVGGALDGAAAQGTIVDQRSRAYYEQTQQQGGMFQL